MEISINTNINQNYLLLLSSRLQVPLNTELLDENAEEESDFVLSNEIIYTYLHNISELWSHTSPTYKTHHKILFQGNVTKEGRFTGFVKLAFPEGFIYEGFCMDGYPEYYGKLIEPNKNFYLGELRDGCKILFFLQYC